MLGESFGGINLQRWNLGVLHFEGVLIILSASILSNVAARFMKMNLLEKLNSVIYTYQYLVVE